jgi:peptidoglycan hydrolase CwlO-like protein
MNGIKRREEEYKKVRAEIVKLTNDNEKLLKKNKEKEKQIAEKNALIEKLQKELEAKK